MVQMFTQEQLMPPSPLGQALGIGLEGAVSSFNKAREDTRTADSIEAIGVAMGLSPEKSKALRGLSSNPELAKVGITAFANQQKAGEKETATDKKFADFKADTIVSHLKEGASQKGVFEDNLNWLESNKENVGRTKAVTGVELGPFKSSLFTEYENRGNLVLDGVIRIFNKAGVLPQKKLEWIRKTFAISPFDTQEQISGKINSLRSLSKTASSFDEELDGLIEKHGLDIPDKDFMNIRSSINSKLNEFDAAVSSPQKEEVVTTLSNTGYKTGDTATNSETGESFIFKGNKWIKQNR